MLDQIVVKPYWCRNVHILSYKLLIVRPSVDGGFYAFVFCTHIFASSN